MTARRVQVSAPSRLHFGMLSVKPGRGRQYGGLGAMIAAPRVSLSITAAPQLQAVGPLAGRAMRIARYFHEQLAADGEAPDRLACRIEIHNVPRQHVGLGTGTQLGMAVVAGLNAFLGGPPWDAAETARRAGRGRRSAIGLYGFAGGGLVFEIGKMHDEQISPLIERGDLPEAWRFVLICPRDEEGLAGESEHRAFACLAPVPPETTHALERLAREAILPAAASADFDRFSEALFDFGYRSGMIFAQQQGGPFAGPQLTELVDWLRGHGVRGVAQSSWGPTLFAVLPDQPAAERLVQQLRNRPDHATLDVSITAADNQGAVIEVGE